MYTPHHGLCVVGQQGAGQEELWTQQSLMGSQSRETGVELLPNLTHPLHRALHHPISRPFSSARLEEWHGAEGEFLKRKHFRQTFAEIDLTLTLWSSFLRRCLPSRPCSGSWSQRRVTQRKCCWRRSSEPWRRGFDRVAIRKLASQKWCGPEGGGNDKYWSIIFIFITFLKSLCWHFFSDKG